MAATLTAISTPSNVTITTTKRATSTTGSIPWTAVGIPADATIISCVLNGTLKTSSSSISGATINDISITTSTSGAAFNVNIGNSNPSTATVKITHTSSTFYSYTANFTSMTYTVTYSVNNKHTVTFVDWDGTVLSTQVVDVSGAATPPASPIRSGYTFTGWNAPYDNITQDVSISAVYSTAATSNVYLDSNNINNIYLGDTKILKIYLGETIIYQAQ